MKRQNISALSLGFLLLSGCGVTSSAVESKTPVAAPSSVDCSALWKVCQDFVDAEKAGDEQRRAFSDPRLSKAERDRAGELATRYGRQTSADLEEMRRLGLFADPCPCPEAKRMFQEARARNGAGLGAR